jgi:flagellar hook-basal body complex protein FliE
VIPAIPAIPSVGSAVSAGASQAASGASAAGAAGAANASPAAGAASGATTGTAPTSFSDVLGNAIDSLDASQQSATNLSLQAATGNANIADVTVASTEADLETQLVTSVRDKAVDAFNSIMNMQA